MRKSPRLLDLYLATHIGVFLVTLGFAQLKPWRSLLLSLFVTGLLITALLSSALQSPEYRRPTNWSTLIQTLNNWRQIEQQLPPSRAVTEQRMRIEAALRLSPTPRQNVWIWPAPSNPAPNWE